MDDPAFSGRLMPGERIVWTGRLRGGVMFTGQDVLAIPFSLAWCGFAIFWEFSVWRSHAPDFFMLWGAIFVVMGLYFVAGRFVFDAWVRGRLRYALTDRRALILRPKPFGALIAVSLDRLSDAQLIERGDGRGTIRFGQPPPGRYGRGVSNLSPALDPTPQFLVIEDAPRVFDLVQRAIARRP